MGNFTYQKRKKTAVLSNCSEKDAEIKTNLSEEFDVYLIDENNFYTRSNVNLKNFTLKQNHVAVIKNYENIE